MSSLELERAIAITTSDAASEWRSVESEVWRYPQRPGSSSFDDMAENSDIWRMGPRGVKNPLDGAERCRMMVSHCEGT